MFDWSKFCLLFVSCWPNRPIFASRDCIKVTLEQWSFLEKIFRIKLAERTWVKLVTLDTIHWYCDGLEPTTAARRYNSQARRRKSVAHYFFILFIVVYLTLSFCPF